MKQISPPLSIQTGEHLEADNESSSGLILLSSVTTPLTSRPHLGAGFLRAYVTIDTVSGPRAAATHLFVLAGSVYLTPVLLLPLVFSALSQVNNSRVLVLLSKSPHFTQFVCR